MLTYTLTIQNLSSESAVRNFYNTTNPSVPTRVSFGVDTKIVPYNSANIEGNISIEGSEKVMPVSLRVAEFYSDTGKRKEKYDAISGEDKVSKLDPSKPVWVVVHGMNSSETETKINELTKALVKHPSMQGAQVVTVDWSEAAKSRSNTGTDAPWTKAVGTWTANQLLNLGFSPEQISGIAHSHGTYDLYFMGEELSARTGGKQMNTLIALDPAGNPPWTGFNHTKINFADVSARATAFEAAWIADSNLLASTADLTFKIDSPITYRPSTEHSLGMNLFTKQLQADASSAGNLSSYFGLDALRTLTEKKISDTYTRNKYGALEPAYIQPSPKFAEALISVDVDWTKIDGKDFANTTPRTLKRYNPVTGIEETLQSDLILP